MLMTMTKNWGKIEAICESKPPHSILPNHQLIPPPPSLHLLLFDKQGILENSFWFDAWEKDKLLKSCVILSGDKNKRNRTKADVTRKQNELFKQTQRPKKTNAEGYKVKHPISKNRFLGPKKDSFLRLTMFKKFKKFRKKFKTRIRKMYNLYWRWWSEARQPLDVVSAH